MTHRDEFEIRELREIAQAEPVVRQVTDAVTRAVAEHRMTFITDDGHTLAAVVPVGVAVAMEPSTVRLAGDSSWTELPAGGMWCPAGLKIGQVTWLAGRPEALHDDDTSCTHTMWPVDEPVT